jgi:hypothetical protein
MTNFNPTACLSHETPEPTVAMLKLKKYVGLSHTP